MRELTEMARKLQDTIKVCGGGEWGQCAILDALSSPELPHCAKGEDKRLIGRYSCRSGNR